MTTYCWCVPVSSEAPHTAHLLPERSDEMVPMLCKPHTLANRAFATPVDSERYEFRCKACRSEFAKLKDAYILITDRPTLLTSADVTRAQERR